jgi:hypothetical protein
MKKLTFSVTLALFFALLASCGSSSSTTTYTIGGTVSSLSGTLVLQNNTADDLTVTANGAFTFATAVNSGATYAVTVLTNPTGQTCTVTSGSGTAAANVTDVTVACVYTNKIIYITTSTIDGNVGGVTEADAICAADLSKPDGGTYKALITDGSTRVACTTAGCSGGATEHTNWVLAASTDYYRSDGTTKISTTNANGIFNFNAGDLTNSFSSTGVGIWTGLVGTWIMQTDGTCSSWTSNSPVGLGVKGNTDKTTSASISDSAFNCNSLMHLACVAQ